MDAATLKTLLLDTIKKNIGVNFTFTEEGECLLEEAASEADDKRRAALIINALNVTDNGQVENKYNPEYYIADCVEDLYDEDDPEESYLKNPELNKIEKQQIIDVEFENHLPVSITFTELEWPITSIAFMGVIKNVFFGDKNEWVYDPSIYKVERHCAEMLGIGLPDSVYQLGCFIGYITKYASIFEGLLTQHHMGYESPFFDLMGELSATGELLKDPDTGLDEGAKKDLLNTYIDAQFSPVTEKRIELFRADGPNGSIFYNKKSDRYMGFYWFDEDGVRMYLSLIDYVNSELSYKLEGFLLLAAFRTFVKVNEIIFDEGIEYKITSHEGWRYRADFSCNGCKFKPEDGSDKAGNYIAGWLVKGIPWDA